MPRGKRTVYAGFCEETNDRLCTVRIHKRDKADFPTLMKYNPRLKRRVKVRLKEEKHSS